MNKWMQTIRFKILLAMGICLILMAGISIFSVSAISRLKSNVSDSFTEVTIPIVDLEKVRGAQLLARLSLRRALVARDAATTQQTVAAVRADLDVMTQAWADYYPQHVSNDTERAVADRIRDGLAQFGPACDKLLGLLGSGSYDEAASLFSDQSAAQDALLDAVSEDVTINVGEGKAFNTDSRDTARTALITAIALLVAGVGVVAGTSIYLLRAISGPLDQAIGVANEIAGGKLDNRIDEQAGGELGDLLRALGTMDRQISQTVRGIQTSAESVTVASREIASGNMDLSARTEEQAASLEETAASMTQLTETVRQNAENARQANGLATGATDLAGTGDEAVRAMVGTIEQISGSSSKISEITGVIEGIAFQTNILALNAAVEAARAGEQGRGFAVVASEVRSLAQRSASAAKEIKELISSSVAMIEGGSKQAVGVGETMGQVRQAIKRVSDIVGEIAAASEEQSRGIEQVNQAVSQMDEVTQQNAALVEQAAAAAQSLEEQAASLKDATSVFRLGHSGAVATPSAHASAYASGSRPAIAGKRAVPALKTHHAVG